MIALCERIFRCFLPTQFQKKGFQSKKKMSQEKAAKEDLISDPVEATTDANLINNPARILTIAICKGFSRKCVLVWKVGSTWPISRELYIMCWQLGIMPFPSDSTAFWRKESAERMRSGHFTAVLSRGISSLVVTEGLFSNLQQVCIQEWFFRIDGRTFRELFTTSC